MVKRKLLFFAITAHLLNPIYVASAIHKEGFLNWCKNSDNFETVNILKEKLKSSNCQTIFKQISASNHLHLDGCGLEDVSFLPYFPHLIDLDLESNLITSTSEIHSLPYLRRLWLDENLIQLPITFESLASLELYSLWGNPGSNAAGAVQHPVIYDPFAFFETPAN